MIGAGGGLVIITRTFLGVLIRIESESLTSSKNWYLLDFERCPQPQVNDTQNRRQQPLIGQELAGIAGPFLRSRGRRSQRLRNRQTASNRGRENVAPCSEAGV
jgi:hypothetical protein